MAALLDVTGPRPTDPDLRGLVVAGLVRDGCGGGRRGAARLREARLRSGGRSPVTARTSPASRPRERPSAGTSRRSSRTADRYGADRIVLARRGSIRRAASASRPSLAADAGGTTGTTARVDGNGWDAVALAAGASLTVPVASATSRIELEIRLLTAGAVGCDRPGRDRQRGRGPLPRSLAGTTVTDADRSPELAAAGFSDFVSRDASTCRPGRRSHRGGRPDHGPVGQRVRGRPAARRRLDARDRRPTTPSSGSARRDPRPPPSAGLGRDLDRAARARRVAVAGRGSSAIGWVAPTRDRSPSRSRSTWSILVAWAGRSLEPAGGGRLAPFRSGPLIPMTAFANTINNVTPGSVGELVRLYLLRAHHGVGYTTGAAVVLIERVVAIGLLGASAARPVAGLRLRPPAAPRRPGRRHRADPVAQPRLPGRDPSVGAHPPAAARATGRARALGHGDAVARPRRRDGRRAARRSGSGHRVRRLDARSSSPPTPRNCCSSRPPSASRSTRWPPGARSASASSSA